MYAMLSLEQVELRKSDGALDIRECEEPWKSMVSAEAKDLLRAMLCVQVASQCF
jgi:hypothetical protein